MIIDIILFIIGICMIVAFFQINSNLKKTLHELKKINRKLNIIMPNNEEKERYIQEQELNQEIEEEKDNKSNVMLWIVLGLIAIALTIGFLMPF